MKVLTRMSLFDKLRAILPNCTPTIREGGTSLIPQERLAGNAELVRRAVAALPNTSGLFPTREAFLAVGYAIKAALAREPDEALELYQDWCARWMDGTNDPEFVEAEWRRMKPPFRRGASWLFDLAHQHGAGAFDAAEQWFVTPTALASLFQAPLFPEASVQADRRLQFVPFSVAAEQALIGDAPPLVKGMLDQGAMSVIYGPSNIGKSFLVADIAHHVATGRPWGGLRTTQTGVVLVAAEGGRGAKKRAKTLMLKYGDAPAFHLLLSSVDLFDAAADLQPLIAAIQALGVPIGFIILDTLARAMAGGDENSTKDMSAFVKNVDTLRSATGAHVCLVHHSGKDESKGARGSSALRAATDTEIEISEGRLAATKQRDMDKSFTVGFELDVVALGRDSDGDPVTSCTVRLVDTARTSPADRLVGQSAEVFGAVEALMGEHPGGVSRAQVEVWITEFGSVAKPGGVRTQLRKLTVGKMLHQPREGLWALRRHSNDALVAKHFTTVGDKWSAKSSEHSIFD